MRHTKPWKANELVGLKKLLDDSKVVAIASLEGFPANLFAVVRKKLKGKAKVKVSKSKVVKKALLESKHKNSKIDKKTKGSIALICTSSMNPFELYNFLKKNKGNTFAKPGSIAQNDITVPAMDTGLPPGPALSDLKQAGLSVRIQGATIAIAEDKVVAKKGEEIKPAVASVLSKLDIKPIKVGLKVVAVYDGEMLYPAEALDVDEEQLYSDIQIGYRNALNLAVFVEYFSKDSVEAILKKAVREANALNSVAGTGEKAEESAETPEKKPVEEKKEDSIEKSSEEKPAEGKQEGKENNAAEKDEEKKEEAKTEKNPDKKKEEKSEKKEESGKVEEKTDALDKKEKEVN